MAKEVNVEIEYKRLGEIDNLNEKFTAEICITSRWIDTNLIDKDYDSNVHWNPKLYVKNLISEPKESNTYELESLSNGFRVIEVKKIKGQFWERMELYDVPFDLQELNVIVLSRAPPDQIKLIANTNDYYLMNKDTKRTFVDQQKWKLFTIYKMKNNLDTSQMEKRKTNLFKFKNDVEKNLNIKSKPKPKIVATCYVARHPGYYLFNAFFLIFLITVSALTVFSIPKNTPQSRLQTTYTILLSSVSFKWVFNRSLPSVSYLTLLDMYSICGIVYITLLAAWHSLIGTYSKQWDPDTDQWMLLAFGLLFIIGHVCFYLRYLAITKQRRELTKIETDILLTNNLEDADEC